MSRLKLPFRKFSLGSSSTFRLAAAHAPRERQSDSDARLPAGSRGHDPSPNPARASNFRGPSQQPRTELVCAAKITAGPGSDAADGAKALCCQ